MTWIYETVKNKKANRVMTSLTTWYKTVRVDLSSYTCFKNTKLL